MERPALDVTALRTALSARWARVEFLYTFTRQDNDEVVLCPDIFSTGLSGAESANVRVGDAVAVFAQGPIGLCATLGAMLGHATLTQTQRF